jgi:hypothetical protein
VYVEKVQKLIQVVCHRGAKARVERPVYVANNNRLLLLLDFYAYIFEGGVGGSMKEPKKVV